MAADHDSKLGNNVTVGQVALVQSHRRGGATLIGVVARTESGYDLLRRELTATRVSEGLGLTKDTDLQRHELPKLWALSFVIDGLGNSASGPSLHYDREGRLVGATLLDVELPNSECSA